MIVPPGETNVPFTQVEDDLSFPMPRRDELDAYVVYIGFDRSGGENAGKETKPAKKPAPVSQTQSLTIFATSRATRRRCS